MRLEACASAGDAIALSERRARTAAIKGVDKLRRKGKRFICRGFHLLGQEAFPPAEYIVPGARQRKPCAGFYRHFVNRVETCSCNARGFDDGISFSMAWRPLGGAFGGSSALPPPDGTHRGQPVRLGLALLRPTIGHGPYEILHCRRWVQRRGHWSRSCPGRARGPGDR